MNKLIKFFIISAILLFFGLLLSIYVDLEDINSNYIVRGDFNPNLKSLNSINAFDERLSEILITKKVENKDTNEVVNIIDSLLRQRFYHGTSRFNLNENWLAWVAGEFLWDDLRMIVDPNELLRRKTTACNQINIVFHRILKRRGIHFRPVGLNKHLISEVKYEGKWHYFDPDYEVKIDRDIDAESLISNPSLFKSTYYNTDGKSFNNNFTELLETNKIQYYPADQELAFRLNLLQSFFQLISFYGWIIFGFIGLVIYLWTHVWYKRNQ